MHHARVAKQTVGVIEGKVFLSEPGTKAHENYLQARLQKLLHYTPDPKSFLINAYVKSGTHWCWEIMMMLMRKNSEISSLHKECMFLDLINMETMASLPHPHIYNTHFEPKTLPEAFGSLRTVYLIRNPKDVMVSAFYHLQLQVKDANPSGLGLWTWDEHFQLWMDTSAGKYTECWYDFTKQAWDRRRDDNKILLFYEDLVREPEVQISNLATFMGIDVSNELVSRISSTTQIDSLRAGKSALTTSPERQIFLSLFRQGKIGDWRNHLTGTQNEEFNLMHREMMRGYEECDSILQPYM